MRNFFGVWSVSTFRFSPAEAIAEVKKELPVGEIPFRSLMRRRVNARAFNINYCIMSKIRLAFMRVSRPLPGKARKIDPSVDGRDKEKLIRRLKKPKRPRSAKRQWLSFVFRGAAGEYQKA